jgi:hypothetical protein
MAHTPDRGRPPALFCQLNYFMWYLYVALCGVHIAAIAAIGQRAGSLFSWREV